MQGILVKCAAFFAGYLAGMVVKEREFGIVLTKARAVMDAKEVG